MEIQLHENKLRRIALSEFSYTVYILEAVCLTVRFELHWQLICHSLSMTFSQLYFFFLKIQVSKLVFLSCLAAWHRRICGGQEESNLFYDASLQALIKSESGYLKQRSWYDYMQNITGKLSIGCFWEVRSSKVLMLTISKSRKRGRSCLSSVAELWNTYCFSRHQNCFQMSNTTSQWPSNYLAEILLITVAISAFSFSEELCGLNEVSYVV